MAKRLGRKTALTDDIKNAICENIRIGMRRHDAALLAGVPHSTFYYWLSRGEAEQTRVESGARPRPTEKIFLDFLDAVKRAEAECKKTAMVRITQAADEHWQAAAWKLERLWPREFGQQVLVRQQVEQQVKQELEKVIDRLEQRLDGETLAHVLAIIADEDSAETFAASSGVPDNA